MFLTRSRIPSSARSLGPYCKHTKLGDADWFAFLKGGFEQLKNPIQQRGCIFLRDPGFLMNALSDVCFSHLVLFRLRQEALLRLYSFSRSRRAS